MPHGYPISARETLPEWLFNEWNDINVIEPKLFPDSQLLDSIPFYYINNSTLSKNYIDMCYKYGNDVSHVFLAPWIKTGGAELVMFNYINALIKSKLADNIVLILTRDADLEWQDKLPPSVRIIELGKNCSSLSPDKQEKLLATFLTQMSPKIIHNINSDLGYRIFTKFGETLSQVSNLFISVFCEDITIEGKITGYPFMYLPNCIDNLTGIFLDNQNFIDKLCNIYAFDKNKFHVHYQPIKLCKAKDIPVINKDYFNILWAGRLDRQKKPDILLKIAEKCKGLPFKFHVYGSAVLDKNKYETKLSTLPNIVYYGKYDRLFSLDTSKYDIFLYTSQWDGLPNVILEAMACGLPVIAPKIGGIPKP